MRASLQQLGRKNACEGTVPALILDLFENVSVEQHRLWRWDSTKVTAWEE